MLTVTQITNYPARLYPGKFFLNGLEFSCFLNINDKILELIFIFSSYFFTLWLVFGSDYSFFIMKLVNCLVMYLLETMRKCATFQW